MHYAKPNRTKPLTKCRKDQRDAWELLECRKLLNTAPKRNPNQLPKKPKCT